MHSLEQYYLLFLRKHPPTFNPAGTHLKGGTLMKPRTTFEKRRKEQERQERQRDKVERREKRKERRKERRPNRLRLTIATCQRNGCSISLAT